MFNGSSYGVKFPADSTKWTVQPEHSTINGSTQLNFGARRVTGIVLGSWDQKYGNDLDAGILYTNKECLFWLNDCNPYHLTVNHKESSLILWMCLHGVHASQK